MGAHETHGAPSVRALGQPMEHFTERRRQERVACHYPAQISVVFPDDTFTPHSCIVLVSEVSQGGLRVRHPEPANPGQKRRPKEGQYVRLYYRGGDASARVYCRVCWIEDGSMDERSYYDLGLEYDVRDKRAQGAVETMLRQGMATSLHADAVEYT